MARKKIGVSAMQGVFAHLVPFGNGKFRDESLMLDIGPGLKVYYKDRGQGKVVEIVEYNNRYYAKVRFGKMKKILYWFQCPEEFNNGTLKVKSVKMSANDIIL